MRSSKKSKATFFILLFSFSFQIGFSQSVENLDGNVYLMCFFITDRKNSWTDEEKEKTLEKLDSATNWIINESKLYENQVYFENKIYGLEEEFIFKKLKKMNKYYWVPKALISEVGFESEEQINEWLCAHLKYPKIRTLIFIKGRGRSTSSICGGSELNACDMTNGAFIYTKYRNRKIMTTSEIAHELLHLFGASDLYHTSETNKEKAKKIEEVYPNSIMANNGHQIDLFNIDPLTAWLLGWNKNPKEWYPEYK